MNAGFNPPHVRGFLRFAAVVACLLLVSCAGVGGWNTSSSSTTTPSSENNPAIVRIGARTDRSTNGSARFGVKGFVNNVASVVIGSGPVGTNSNTNVPFVSVTLCHPGTSTCQTIDHVLVDTGSYGLRIIAPGVLGSALALPAVIGPAGNPVGECAQLYNGFFWGSVRLADVKIAGETAPSLPIQQVSDVGAVFKNIPSGCGNRGANTGTVAALGANGILGVGLFTHDCGTACARQIIAGTYYECTASNCTGTVMPLVNQVSNPVAAFATDNNGVVLVMPAVAAGGAKTLKGVLIFGIDTQTNNKIGSATVYSANNRGNFTTTYKGTSLASSFLDSGSNGLFFYDPTIRLCSESASFYCPATTLSLSAVNTSSNGAVSGTVNFTVENMQTLDGTVRAASVGGSIGRNPHSTAFGWLSAENMQTFDGTVRAASVRGNIGRNPRSTAFVWGMPFFFGRRVFVVIDGATTLHGPGPYWAY